MLYLHTTIIMYSIGIHDYPSILPVLVFFMLTLPLTKNTFCSALVEDTRNIPFNYHFYQLPHCRLIKNYSYNTATPMMPLTFTNPQLHHSNPAAMRFVTISLSLFLIDFDSLWTLRALINLSQKKYLDNRTELCIELKRQIDWRNRAHGLSNTIRVKTKIIPKRKYAHQSSLSVNTMKRLDRNAGKVIEANKKARAIDFLGFLLFSIFRPWSFAE